MNMSERATMSTDDGAAQADNAAESWDGVQGMSKAAVAALPHLSGKTCVRRIKNKDCGDCRGQQRDLPERMSWLAAVMQMRR